MIMKIEKLLFAMMLLLPSVGYGQNKTIQSQLDSISANVEDITKQLAGLTVAKVFSNTYKLYPTENMYTFLQLDTSNGKIKQLQWNLDRDKEFTTILNDMDLTYGIKIGNLTERFELYPTQNMYQFILLDKSLGSMWHVQWGMEESKRWIRPIN